jgi:thiol:disulfide interchange protein DsbD
MAIYFLNPILPDMIAEYSLPVFAVLSAIYLLFFDTNGHQIKVFRAIKTLLMVVIIGVSVYFAYPAEKASPNWQKYSQEAYEQSLQNDKPVVVDFYADWCIPCKELDAMTFSDPDVIEKMKEFDNYKVDMTKTMSDRTERIRNKFDIVGMPTVILINSKGEEVKRITGFVNAEEFLSYLNKID